MADTTHTEGMTAPDTPTLLPCPFCGSPAVASGGWGRRLNDPREWKVECIERGKKCSINARTRYVATADEAFTIWNARAPSSDAAPTLAAEVIALREALQFINESPSLSECHRVAEVALGAPHD